MSLYGSGLMDGSTIVNAENEIKEKEGCVMRVLYGMLLNVFTDENQ
jgi:hypothetical protein